jgi:hypothetical protein
VIATIERVTTWIEASEVLPELTETLGRIRCSRRVLVCAGGTVLVGILSQWPTLEPAWVDSHEVARRARFVPQSGIRPAQVRDRPGRGTRGPSPHPHVPRLDSHLNSLRRQSTLVPVKPILKSESRRKANWPAPRSGSTPSGGGCFCSRGRA